MLRVALLGRYSVYVGEMPLELALRPVRLLLAYLVLNRDRSHSREQLAGMLWPGYTDASARKNLRNTIYRLKKAIGDDHLVVDRTSVAFNMAANYWLDVEQLEQAATGGPVATLLAAAEAYQGELMPGFYEEWVVWERERLQAACARLMGALLASLQDDGRWEACITWAERWIAQGQTPEPAYRALMRAHAARGDYDAMARTYRRATEALEQSLGVAPAAETEQLYQELLSGSAAFAGPTEETVPAENKIRLPVHETPFIGRRREVNELAQMLCQQNGGRLVTIVGPGGIGKTRLAIQAAASAAGEFADGVFFVPLAPLTEDRHLTAAISDSLGHRPVGDDPLQSLLAYLGPKQLLLLLDNFEHLLAGAELVSKILRHAPQVRVLCTTRERLNLSGETVYGLSGLDYPDDQSLSLEALGQYGAVQLLLDRARQIRPATEEDESDVQQAARISGLVQGMPLALILASSWLELLTFRELADEIGESLDILESGLRDLPERQRSVRATFEYSWGRLADEEQTIFSRLAIFRGGFSRRAAQQVAGAGLRDLRILLEKSLITAEGPDRYAVHELLRQFAEEKLEAAGQAGTIRDAHSRYYLQALAEKEIDLKGRRQLEALWEIEVDLGNVRAAWDYALDAGNWQEIDVALEGLSLYHYIHSKNQEGWSLLTRALAQLDTLQTTGSGDAGATSKRLAPQAEEWAGLWARLVSRAGMLQAQFATSAPESERELQRSLAIAHDLDDLPQIAHTCLALGHYHSRSSGDYAQAASYFSRSLELYRALGDDFFVAHLLHRVGYALEPLEGLEPFLSYTSQSLALAQQIGDLADAGNALGNLGAAVISKGDYDGAKAYLSDALAIYTQMPHREGMAHNLIHLALLEFLDGQMEQARGWATESYVLAKETVSWVSTAYSLAVLSILATVADCDCEKGRQLATQNQTRSSNLFGDFSGHWSHAAALAGLDRSDEAFRQLQAGLRFCTDGDWQAIITWTLPIFAIIYAQKDQPYRAAELLGLFFNHPMSPLGWAEKWPLLSETQERLEAALGEDGYKAAWDAGRELDLSKTAESLLHDEI